MGLDRGDLVVERRLAQKMGFLLESEADPLEPTTEDLEALRADEPGLGSTPGRYRFEHRVFRHDRTDPDGDARRALTSGAVGDPFIHGTHADLPRREVDARFGPGFADSLEGLSQGVWSDPVPGTFGMHLVRPTSIEPPEPAPLEAVRAALVDRWRQERRATLRAERVQALIDRYDIHREVP